VLDAKEELQETYGTTYDIYIYTYIYIDIDIEKFHSNLVYVGLAQARPKTPATVVL